MSRGLEEPPNLARVVAEEKDEAEPRGAQVVGGAAEVERTTPPLAD